MNLSDLTVLRLAPSPSRFCTPGRNGNGKGNCTIGFRIVAVATLAVSFERIFVGGKESRLNHSTKDPRTIEKLHGKDFSPTFLYVHLLVTKL